MKNAHFAHCTLFPMKPGLCGSQANRLIEGIGADI